ncbi:MarR family transcriptional regulator [Rhizobium sp. KVB221]|uniref:MarR family transcriptional regulator n=2 Tax=Rhizobium setariae TaxID=2801340 RepID=A0A936YR01_9HYPH|nr:MarR family transcriptional regulator [Rhizobium setariae]MBL0370962.1 MarR family transcriptional regulator [Rhizobium setariae]
MNNVTRKARTLFDNHVKEKGLTLARARILRLLANSNAGATQRTLAHELEIEGPTLVRVLDNLEAQGCIERLAVATDRRAKQIVLTEEGIRQAAEVEGIVEHFRAAIQGDIAPDDLQVVLRVIAQMNRNLELLQ